MHKCKKCEREFECEARCGRDGCRDFEDGLCGGCREEDALDRSYKVGISSGLEQAANFVMEEATTLFAVGNDEDARRLRRIAHELKKRADKAHPGVPKT